MKSVQRFSSVGNLSKRLNSGSWIEWWPQSDDDDDVWRLVLHHHWFISLTTAIECEIAPLLLSVCFIDSNVDLLLLCYCKTIQETFLWPQICPSGPVGHSNVFPINISGVPRCLNISWVEVLVVVLGSTKKKFHLPPLVFGILGLYLHEQTLRGFILVILVNWWRLECVCR